MSTRSLPVASLHPISRLVLSFISTATTKEEMVRAHNVASRAISRLPDEDTALMPGICDAYNAAHLAASAISSRLEGYVAYAMQCEVASSRLLEYWGF